MRASVALTAVVAWIAAGTAGAQWGFVEEAKLIPSGAKDEERAGHAVALSGDTVVLGVPLRDHSSSVYGSVRGLAYHTGKQALHGSDEITGTLLSISVSTGVATSVGKTYYQPAGLAFDPSQNSFYVGDESGLLWRVKTNGTLTGAWDTGVTLADTLYGSTSDQLVIIVPGPPGGIWASASIVGPLGFSDVRGLEFDPASGTLYGADCATDQLLSIDPATGTATALGTLGFGMVEGLALDTATNTLYGSDTESDQIVVIDPLAGAALPVRSVVQVQLWYRDPLNPSGETTSFSDAIEVWVLP